jgi:hypothetical protein
MPTVTFSTHCYEGDRDKLYKNLPAIVKSHDYKFDEIQIVHQRCENTYKQIHDASKPIIYGMPLKHIGITHPTGYNRLLQKFNIPTEDPRADEITHGPDSAHYWKHHCVNHLAGLESATSEYIVFSDSDCIMIRNEPYSWIDEGIKMLENNPEVFVVSPSDGNPCLTWLMSQQLFLIRRQDFLDMDFNCWDGKFIEGGPFQEFYPMMEGRISMYMRKHNLYRQVLTSNWRWFHDWEHHKEPKELYDLAMEALE